MSIKYLAFFLFLLFTFFSCNNNTTTYNQLILIDSLLSKNLLDSAATELEFIDEDNLLSDENIAYYNLLNTQIRWKLYQPIASDSAIDFSIEYYKKTKDYVKLANSYFYKGVINENISYPML